MATPKSYTNLVAPTVGKLQLASRLNLQSAFDPDAAMALADLLLIMADELDAVAVETKEKA